jgi:hypothetical protein
LYQECLLLRRELSDKTGIADVLERLAQLAGAQRQPRRGACLFGAAAALRQVIGAPLSPNERAECEQAVAALRAVMGEQAFAAAWTEGWALSLEEAIELALEGHAVVE